MCSVDVLEYILSSIYENVLLLKLTDPAKRIDRDNYDVIDYTHQYEFLQTDHDNMRHDKQALICCYMICLKLRARVYAPSCL